MEAMFSKASTALSGFFAAMKRPPSACAMTAVSEWATMSCISRAMRVRSAMAASSARSRNAINSRSRRRPLRPSIQKKPNTASAPGVSTRPTSGAMTRYPPLTANATSTPADTAIHTGTNHRRGTCRPRWYIAKQVTTNNVKPVGSTARCNASNAGSAMFATPGQTRRITMTPQATITHAQCTPTAHSGTASCPGTNTGGS